MIRTVALATMMTLADKKALVRQAAIKTLDAYSATSPTALDVSLIHSAPKALTNDSPELRENLLGWFAAELKKRQDSLPDLSEFLVRNI